MPGIFDVLAANGILSSIFGGQASAPQQGQAENNQQTMMDILAGRKPVPTRSNSSELMSSNPPPAIFGMKDVAGEGAYPNTPMIVQAMQSGNVPPGAALSYDNPDTAREVAQAAIDPRTIPSAPDPFANTYNTTATAFQNAKDQGGNFLDTLGIKTDRPLARLGNFLMAAGSKDPAGTLAELQRVDSELTSTKVTPLADGAFSLVQKKGEAPKIVRNDQVANYLGDLQTTRFQQALQKVILGGQVQANTAADKAAIKAGEDAQIGRAHV